MVYIAIILAIVALAIMLERLMCGTHIESLFYNKPIKAGDAMHIYMDGCYNRTAVVSRIEPHRVFIYGKLPLSIKYRGRFYATGYTADGRPLIYVGNRNHYRFVRLAELLRVIFGIADNAYMLEPNAETPVCTDLEGNSDDDEA